MAERARIAIVLDANGNVQVSGAIDNKLVAYGLLEAARDAIRDYHEANAAKHNGLTIAKSLPSAN